MFRAAPEGDELQMNMETISKQLNELMVTEEKDQVANHYHPLPNGINISQSVMNTLSSLEEAAQYVANMCYQQRERALILPPASQVVGAVNNQNGAIPKHNRNNSVHQGQQYHCGDYYIYPNNSYPFVHPGVGYFVNSTPQRFNRGLSQMANQCDNSPKCEFHYLTPQADTGKVGAKPLLSITAAKDDASGRYAYGYFRKQNRYFSKYNFRGQHDYDRIDVDLTTLNISPNGKESSPVLRIFACLRNLHNALAEVPPSFEPSSSDSAYELTFAPVPQIIFPCTMNVQYQVKHASRKLASFFSGLAQIVGNNRIYSQNLAKEFDRYLCNIQPLLQQFDFYKHLELEHKRGQFVSEEIRVHAERLEILLEKLTKVLREVHLRVIAYDWYIGIKYHGKHCQKMEPSIKQRDGPAGQHSKLGVINEILQMCNMTSSETDQPAPNKTPDALCNAPNPTTTAAAFARNNADIERKAQMNTISYKTNENAAIGATSAVTARVICGGLSKSNSNGRQPVFYIG